MALQPGDRIGPYVIGAQLGVGGMGEVYRARDSKLDRDVAIKIISPAFTADPERLSRFEREARTLASLNHTNIAHVYGLEHSDAGYALVMEVVDGDDLAERLKHGALPLDDALPLARQLADAIEAAHDLGIVHRDLKPANVMVRPDGVVKVLDFGLAKALDTTQSSSAPQLSTMTSPAMTQAGVILGTAAYMSPEQAKGRQVDRRADIWAFGCVVFEMLAGRRPFTGEDFADTLSSIMRDAPAWDALPAGTPPRLKDLLSRCLEKDPRKRLRDIGEARIVLEGDVLASPMPAQGIPQPARRSTSWVRTAAWLIGGTLIGAAGAIALKSNQVQVTQTIRATLPLPSSEPMAHDFVSGIALSRDGRRVVYLAAQGNSTVLVARDLNGTGVTRLAGSEGAGMPFFSPNGDWIGFVAEGELRRLPATGGTAVTIARIADDLRQPSWADDDWIWYSVGASGGLSRVKSTGGTPEVVTTPNRKSGEKTHRYPEVLPGGRTVIYTSGSATLASYSDARIVARDIQSGTERTLVEGGVNAHYLPPGYLVYAKAGALYAVEFDATSLTVKGIPRLVQDDVRMFPTVGSASYAVSDNGLLVYARGGENTDQYRLVWVDSKGKAETLLERTTANYGGVLSPDDRQILFPLPRANDQLVSYDLSRRISNTLTTSWDVDSPGWSEDGRTAFGTSNKEHEYQVVVSLPAAGGNPEVVFDKWVYMLDRQTVGGTLAVQVVGGQTRDDIWLISLKDRSGKPLLNGPSSESQPALSPDGKFLAFSSDRAGQFDVYVIKVEEPSVWIPVSSGGGRQVRWARDGRALFYRNGSRMMRVAASATAAGLTISAPALLFDAAKYASSMDGSVAYDVARDGRFLMAEELPGAMPPSELVVVTDWVSELRRAFGSR